MEVPRDRGRFGAGAVCCSGAGVGLERFPSLPVSRPGLFGLEAAAVIGNVSALNPPGSRCGSGVTGLRTNPRGIARIRCQTGGIGKKGMSRKR